MSKKKTAAKKPYKLTQANIDQVLEHVPTVDVGVAVAMPNTTEVKMRAIATIAESNKDLAKALNSVNTTVKVSHCNISNAETGMLITGSD